MLLALLLACPAPTTDDSAPAADTVDADGDGVSPAGGDCDDADPAVFPEAVEVCNEVDDDCDGEVDEDVTTLFFADADADGYGDFKTAVYACTLPAGASENDLDCDDTSAEFSPAAPDPAYDGLDQDCDGEDDDCSDLREYEGNFSVNSADDLTGFCGTYGRIEGNLQIIGLDAPDLTGLDCLCEVRGDVRIWNSTVTSLEGLGSLASTDRLELIGNPGITTLDGLDHLERVNEIELWDLPELVSIEALGSYSGDLSTLQLQELPSLGSAAGLEGVTSTELLQVDQLDALTDAGGFAGLTSATTLTVTTAPALVDLGGFAALTSVSTLTMSGIGAESLDGLGGVTDLDSLVVADNPALGSLDGLAGLTRLKNTDIHGNAALTDIGALAALGADPDDVYVYDNDALTDASPLAGVATPRTMIVIGNALPDYADFAGLTRPSSLWLGEEAPTSFEGLEGLEQVGTLTINGEGCLWLHGLEGLTKVSSLQISHADNLASIGALATVSLGDVKLEDLPALDSLTGLDGWDGGGKDSLTLISLGVTDLGGLEAVTELDGLTVTDNGLLTNLDGLDNLTAVSGDVTVEDNRVLPQADAEALCVRLKGDLTACSVSGNGP